MAKPRTTTHHNRTAIPELVGKKVLIIQAADPPEWKNGWIEDTDSFIGQTLTISHLTRGGFYTRESMYEFPWQSIAPQFNTLFP